MTSASAWTNVRRKPGGLLPASKNQGDHQRRNLRESESLSRLYFARGEEERELAAMVQEDDEIDVQLQQEMVESRSSPRAAFRLL